MLNHRYRVVSTWGRVPDQIKTMSGESDSYLVYPEYRGQTSSQGFLDHDELVGGWFMVYAGRRPTPHDPAECNQCAEVANA